MKLRAEIIAGLLLAGVAAPFAGAAQEAVPTSPGSASRVATDQTPVVGAPFQIDGVTYTPAEVRSYDEVGLAMTATGEAGTPGEPDRAGRIAAAHKTLPLPSYVEITDIATGRTILVRVDTRGPMRNDRLISLTPAAAAQLGIATGSTPGVRVRKVNPSQSERDVLIAGGQAVERMTTSKQLLAVLRRKLAEMQAGPATPDTVRVTAAAPAAAAPPETKAAPVAAAAPPAKAADNKAADTKAAASGSAATSGYFVQIAAFKRRASADGVAAKAAAKVVEGPGVWRVRYGPFASQDAAKKALADARAKGYRAAIIVNDK